MIFIRLRIFTITLLFLTVRGSLRNGNSKFQAVTARGTAVIIAAVDNAAGFFFRYFAARITGEAYDYFAQPQIKEGEITQSMSAKQQLQALLRRQRQQHEDGAIGLVWNYAATGSKVDEAAASAAWNWVAEAELPVLLVQRNALDTLVHNQKLREFKSCIPNAVEEPRYSSEVEKMVEALSCSPRVKIETDGLLQRLEQIKQQQEALQRMLQEQGVQYVQLDFDALIDATTDAQLRSLQPVADAITAAGCSKADCGRRVVIDDMFMEDILLSASSIEDHVENHSEVAAALQGTEFERYLH